MSHYCVAVVTRTPDELDDMLAPYNENDNLTEQVGDDGESYETNPNAKWDWWGVGGRWSGFLTLTNGGTADQARAADIDWERQLARARSETAEHLANVKRLVDGLPESRMWDDVFSTSPDVDAARAIYNSQPRIVALRPSGYGWEPDKWLRLLNAGSAGIDREAVMRSTPYAICSAEGWVEPGRMLWFGVSAADDDDEYAFSQRALEYLTGLPADALVTIVDCHI